MVKRFLSLMTIVSFFLGTFATVPLPRVIGVRDAKPGEFPYQVAIQVIPKFKFGHSCGGSIIAPSWILTAAHCYFGDEYKFRVVAGILRLNDTNPERQQRNVVKFILHPEYIGKLNGFLDDIGLIQLEFPLVFNNFIRAIQLPEPGSEVRGVATLSGWGSSARLHLTIPDQLRTLKVPIFSHLACSSFKKSYSKDKQICGASVFRGVCPGDSGGPLVQNGEVVGIVSHGVLLCGLNVPDYYTKVGAYIDFIEMHVKN